MSLTDYALAIECVVFAMLLARRPATDGLLRREFVVFFASISAASLLGGTMHGFFEYSTSPARAVLWTATLFSILVTSSLPGHRANSTCRLCLTLAAPLALAQILVLRSWAFVTLVFAVAIVAYLPSTVSPCRDCPAYRDAYPSSLGRRGICLTFVAPRAAAQIGCSGVTSITTRLPCHPVRLRWDYLQIPRCIKIAPTNSPEYPWSRDEFSNSSKWAPELQYVPPARRASRPHRSGRHVTIFTSAEPTEVRTIVRPESKRMPCRHRRTRS